MTKYGIMYYIGYEGFRFAIMIREDYTFTLEDEGWVSTFSSPNVIAHDWFKEF